MQIIPNICQVRIGEFLLETEDVLLKLFTNDLTPDQDTILGDITEMTGHAYAAKTLSAASWTDSSGSGGVVKSYAKQTFTFTPTGTVTVYGYFMVDATTGNLICVERFATAQVITTADDDIKITPEMTFRDIAA